MHFSPQDKYRFHWDLRLRERLQSKGEISTQQLQDYLNGLPDLSDAMEVVDIPQPPCCLAEELS